MGDFIEFSGKTTEEALSRAQDHFNAPLSSLEFEVITPGSSGLFGLLGAKKARIKARVQVGGSIAEQMAELAAVVSEPRPARPAARVSEPTPRPAPAAAAPPPPPQPAPRPEAPPRVAEPQPVPAPVSAPAAGPEPPRPSPAVGAAPIPAAVAPPGVEEEQEPEDLGLEPEAELEAEEADEVGEIGDLGEDDDEGGDLRLEQDPAVIEQARAVLARLVEPLDPSAQVVARGGEQGIELAVQGQEAGMLIGRRGTTLEALQYLVVRIVSHQHGRPVRIVVDAGDYRRRRREALEETARRMAQKAKNSGRAVAMGPLAAQERRLIHLALKADQDVVTLSRGRGELKKVIISPRA